MATLFLKVKLLNHWPMSNLSDVISGADLFDGVNNESAADRFCNPNSAIYFNKGYLTAPPAWFTLMGIPL